MLKKTILFLIYNKKILVKIFGKQVYKNINKINWKYEFYF